MKSETSKYFQSIMDTIAQVDASCIERWLEEIEQAEEIRRTTDGWTSMNVMAPNHLAHGDIEPPEAVENAEAPTDVYTWLRFGLHVESQQYVCQWIEGV